MPCSFEQIMNYHRDNWNVYKEIKENLPYLIPFVGAGLTQFAYYSWPVALKELTANLTDKDNKKRITKIIDARNYLEAAQQLENIRTPMNLARDIAHLFSADKLERKRHLLSKEPIALLPHLFPDFVLTTNYDETLETVYNESGHPFQTVFSPGHPELLRQFMRQGGHCGLFKLHGTLTGKMIEYDKIVFTQKQYDIHYSKDSPLTVELKRCFERRSMLFLGCSLGEDRTMELLQEIVRSGDIYYTIIDCKNSERDEKIRKLGNKHIRAILYEAGHYEAVRVILEHLLEETVPDVYQKLSEHIGALKLSVLSERFSYKSPIAPTLVGREKYLQQLKNFLEDADIAFRWWAITGPGGCGKSRLAYEFQKHLFPEWEVHYLGPNDYGDLDGLAAHFAQKTFVIADYVQEHARELGAWMEQLNERKRCLPVRLLLIERDSDANSHGFTWAEQLYTNVYYEKRLKEACYQEDFLYLQPLSAIDLLSIIEDYASALGKGYSKKRNTLTDTEKELLLETLKKSILCCVVPCMRCS